MIISKAQVHNLLKVYEKNVISKPPTVETTPNIMKKDALEISEASKMKQKIMQAIKQSDDIRTDKVESLKTQMAAGKVPVSEDQIAEKMISRAIIDDMA